MTSNEQALQPGNGQNVLPPMIAKSILSFFLPETLRDPILGDLEEEYALRAGDSDSLMRVNRWYWWQVLKSSCLFLWQQRGAGMAYLLSVIFFVLAIFLALVTADFGLWLISPPIIIFIVPTSLLLGIGATSSQTARNAFRLSFSSSCDHSAQTINDACRFLHVTGNQFLLVAGVAFFLGAIQILINFSQNPELISNSSHYFRIGIALIPLFYGLIFKCLFYSAEQKLLGKYAMAQA